MFSILFRSVRPVTQIGFKQLNVPIQKSGIARQSLIKNFHTSTPRQAIPPVFLLLLRPLFKGVAFVAGRNFRFVYCC